VTRGGTSRRSTSEAAADLAQLYGAKLYIVSASTAEQWPSWSATGGYGDPARPAQSLLESLALIGKESREPIIHPASGAPADAVAATADDVRADMVVVGNKGRKGARRVLRSVPNSVAHGAPCSVLIFDSLGAD
jgi:nucleotide-binding universal stress UspA family protein